MYLKYDDGIVLRRTLLIPERDLLTIRKGVVEALFNSHSFEVIGKKSRQKFIHISLGPNGRHGTKLTLLNLIRKAFNTFC